MRTSEHETAVDWGLIDFGGDGGSVLAGGRRLERLGGLLVDRPLVQTGLPVRRLPQAWAEAAAISIATLMAKGDGRFTSRRPTPGRCGCRSRRQATRRSCLKCDPRRRARWGSFWNNSRSGSGCIGSPRPGASGVVELSP